MFLPKSQNAQQLRICIIQNSNQELRFNHKQNISAYPLQPEKMIFLSKNHKNTAFWPKMRNSQ